MKKWALVMLGGCTLAVEHWTGASRATRQEKHRPLPGDALVPEPMWEATRATTIRARPEAVWPWIVQMGYPTHRGGWYTPYWLDRLVFGTRAHSAPRIVPELQTLAVGDRVPDSPDGEVSYFTVAEVQPERALVLLSILTRFRSTAMWTLRGRSCLSRAPKARAC